MTRPSDNKDLRIHRRAVLILFARIYSIAVLCVCCGCSKNAEDHPPRFNPESFEQSKSWFINAVAPVLNERNPLVRDERASDLIKSGVFAAIDEARFAWPVTMSDGSVAPMDFDTLHGVLATTRDGRPSLRIYSLKLLDYRNKLVEIHVRGHNSQPFAAGYARLGWGGFRAAGLHHYEAVVGEDITESLYRTLDRGEVFVISGRVQCRLEKEGGIAGQIVPVMDVVVSDIKPYGR